MSTMRETTMIVDVQANQGENVSQLACMQNAHM